MKFSKIQFVYIDIDYLKYLNELEPEIFYDKDNNYEQKPHLGLLVNNETKEYVIPLTSAKEKHKTWDDVSATWYRIYEIIDITQTKVMEKDIIVEIRNQDILNKIKEEERENYKQRILSVLDIRKMFPIKKGLYKKIKFDINNSKPKKENQRTVLMMKEYSFLCNLETKIEEKATKIYDKQIKNRKILKYHCDYKKLESRLDTYEKQ